MRGHLYWSISVVLLLWICQFGKCWQTYRDHVCLKTNPNSSDYDCYDYGEADFGEVSRHGNNIMGVVILASPSNACSVVTPKSEQNITVSGNLFLLINDGGCAYDFKALKATKGGYDAAIIRNMQSDDLVFLKGGKYESEVSIPAIYVGKDTGELLELNNVIRNPGASVIITPQGPSELWDIEYYMIPFAIIVGICFILMAMFMISRYYRHYLEQRRNRLSPTNLRKIPTKKYKKGDDYYDLCAICLEEYKDGERLRILPCEHAYHCKCVDPWLTEGKRTCPVCKQPVENDKRPRNRRQRVDPEAGESTNDADETTPLISSSSSSPPNSHTVVA